MSEGWKLRIVTVVAVIITSGCFVGGILAGRKIVSNSSWETNSGELAADGRYYRTWESGAKVEVYTSYHPNEIDIGIAGMVGMFIGGLIGVALSALCYKCFTNVMD